MSKTITVSGYNALFPDLEQKTRVFILTATNHPSDQ